MKKRFISSLICILMLLSVLAGCTGKDTPESSSTQKASSGEDNAGNSDEQTGEQLDESGYQKFDDVKLTYLYVWNGGFAALDNQYDNDVNTAIRDKIGVTVEFEGIMMPEIEKLNLMFASGDMPDIVNAPYWGGADGCTQVIQKGAREGRLIDISEMLPNYPNLKDAYKEGIASKMFLENDLDREDFNGGRYIIPWQLPGNANNETNWGYGVFVRGDVPQELGIDPQSIKTSDDLYEFMVAAKEYGFKDINGNDTIIATTYHDGMDVGGYGVNFDQKKSSGYTLEDDGTVSYDTLSQNWIDQKMFTWRMVNEGLLDKECFRHNDDAANEKVGNGTALFASQQYQLIIDSTKLTGLYESNPEMRYVPVGPMNYQDGTPLVQTATDGRTGSPAIFFPSTCENVDAALTWLDYINSEEGARLCQYGFEGDTYELNEDGQPRMNAELTERYYTDTKAVQDELRERGIGYILSMNFVVDFRKDWWGESAAFEADAIPDELKEYREMRPVERIPGYPIGSLAPQYEKYDEVSEFAFEGTTQRDYTERAYFASTEEEARQILEDYQNYIITQKDGLFQEYLDYLAETAKTRDDIVF